MSSFGLLLAFQFPWQILALIAAGAFGLTLLVVVMVYGGLWFQAYMSGADVTLASLVGMGLRKVNPRPGLPGA